MHNTPSQDTLPEIGKKLASKAKRQGVEEHFPDPSVRKTLEGEVSLLAHYDPLLGEVALSLTRSARAHEGQTFSRRQSVPGIGQMLALVMLYERQDLARFPRVQDFVSDCRLVQCAKASNGNRLGTSGQKLGHVH
jgi:transposase